MTGTASDTVRGMRPTDEMEWGKRALALSLCLHAAAFLAFPALNKAAPKPQARIEVELAPPPEIASPAPEAPQLPEPVKIEKPVLRPVTPREPEPQQQAQTRTALPLLAANEESVAAETDYTAPEVAMPAPAENIPPGTSPGPTPPVDVASAPVSPPESSGGAEDDSWRGYGQLLYEYAKKNRNYPQMAIRRGLQGRVKVSVKLAIGKLVDIMVVESSGHKVLDDQALEMVRKAINELPVRESLAKKLFTVVIPVEFKLAG